MKTLKLNYTGRKARIGKICFDENGHMYVFISYCPDCRSKVVMTIDEAKQFSRLYLAEQGSLWSRVVFGLISRRRAYATTEEVPHKLDNKRLRQEIIAEVTKALQTSQ